MPTFEPERKYMQKKGAKNEPTKCTQLPEGWNEWDKGRYDWGADWTEQDELRLTVSQV